MSGKMSHHDQTTLKLHWVCRNYHFKDREFYLLCSAYHTAYINISKGQKNCSKSKTKYLKRNMQDKVSTLSYQILLSLSKNFNQFQTPTLGVLHSSPNFVWVRLECTSLGAFVTLKKRKVNLASMIIKLMRCCLPEQYELA